MSLYISYIKLVGRISEPSRIWDSAGYPPQNQQQKRVSDETNPGCLGCIGDYTTQLYGDFNKPI